MTLDGLFKAFLKWRYFNAFIKTLAKKGKKNENNSSSSSVYDKAKENELPSHYVKSPVPTCKAAYYPDDVQVAIHDATGKIKYYTYANSGANFVYEHVLHEAITFLAMPTETEAFFICFDRGAPVNKSGTHKQRYKNTNFFDLNLIPQGKVLIDDDHIDEMVSSQETWKAFANDKRLNQELMHYITKTIIEPKTNGIDDDDNMSRMYTPPPNKMLFLFGGLIEPPNPKRTEREPIRPDPQLYYVGNEAVQVTKKSGINSSSSSFSYLNSSVGNFRRVHGVYKSDENFNIDQQALLLEGEIAATYFSKPYAKQGKNVMIITGDGDVLIQALLGCKDRIDSSTGNFVNKLYVRLLVQGDYEDVDINMLYKLMCEDSIFAGINDPAIFFATASCLLENDYFSGYCTGIGVINNKTNEPCPYVLYTLLSMIKDYKYLVTVPFEDHRRGPSFDTVPVIVDEDLFIRFTYQCYVVKYKSAAIKSLESKKKKKGKTSAPAAGDDDDKKIKKIEYKNITEADISLVKNHLKDKAVKNRIPPINEIKVYARMLEWVLNYFYNAYRGNCVIVSPLSTFQNRSYYGWTISILDEICVKADEVSQDKRPSTEHFWYAPPKIMLQLSFSQEDDKKTPSSSGSTSSSGPILIVTGKRKREIETDSRKKQKTASLLIKPKSQIVTPEPLYTERNHINVIHF